MEEIKNASVNINLNEGNIVISGSEDFVERNMEIVFSFVKSVRSDFVNPKPMGKVLLNADNAKTSLEDISVSTDDDKDKYKKLGIYSIDTEGAVSIHRKIPGKNNAEKMKNIALIVLFEKQEAIEGATLKALCEKQGCWDRNNSAAIFEREFQMFIKKKISPQKWTIELTIDGEQAALTLLEEMANEKK